MKLYPILALTLLAALAAIVAAALAEGRQNIPSILLGLAIGVLLLVPAFVIVRRQNRAMNASTTPDPPPSPTNGVDTMSNKRPLLLGRLVSLRLPAELDDRLRELAEEQGITPSELHRRSLHAMLAGIADFGKAEPKIDDANKDEA